MRSHSFCASFLYPPESSAGRQIWPGCVVECCTAYSAGRTFSRARERQMRQRQRGHPQLCPSLCVVPIVARALRAYVANARARRRSWRARGAASQSSLEAVSSARSGARLLPGRAFTVHARARTRWGSHRVTRRDVPAGAHCVL